MKKILRTFSGNEWLLENDEAENVIAVKKKGVKAFLQLRCGAYVDTSAIESIGGVPVIAHSASGKPLSKDGRWFVEDGKRVYVENFAGIQYLPDPKYTALVKNDKLLK